MREWFEQNKQYIAWAIVTLAIVGVGFLGVTYPIPEPPVEQAGLQAMGDVWSIEYWGTELIALDTDGDLTVTGDVNVGDDLSLTGDLAVAGTSDLSGNVSSSVGAVTITDALLVTSTLTANGATVLDTTLTVGGGYGSTGCSISAAGVLQCNGAATIDGNVTTAGALDVQGGDITLENDETISNATDGVVQIGGFTALSEGAVVVVTAAGTITPTASFQPITSTDAITDAVIADGLLAGQLVVIINENAADDIVILESGSNLAAGGDITLTGGAYDAVVLMWDGARWVRLSFFDN